MSPMWKPEEQPFAVWREPREFIFELRDEAEADGYGLADLSLDEAIERLMAIREAIQPEYRETATLRGGDRSEWTEVKGVALWVSYTRPLTDEESIAELSDKERQEISDMAEQRAKERAEYERLRAIFEPSIELVLKTGGEGQPGP